MRAGETVSIQRVCARTSEFSTAKVVCHLQPLQHAPVIKHAAAWQWQRKCLATALLVLDLSSGMQHPAGMSSTALSLSCFVLPLPCRFALSILLLYIAAVIYYLYVRIAFTLDMKDKWCVLMQRHCICNCMCKVLRAAHRKRESQHVMCLLLQPPGLVERGSVPDYRLPLCSHHCSCSWSRCCHTFIMLQVLYHCAGG